eukprot:6210974-Pleurochrysis_carterae.AAC.2
MDDEQVERSRAQIGRVSNASACVRARALDTGGMPLGRLVHEPVPRAEVASAARLSAGCPCGSRDGRQRVYLRPSKGTAAHC